MKMQIFPRGENRDTRGFTLIELAVVLFIISLVLWTALPKITTFGSGGVPDTLRGIASHLENTMEEAVFESAGGMIVINMPRGSIEDMRGTGKDKMKIWSATLPDTLSIQGVTSNFGKKYRDTEVSIPYSSMGYIPHTFIYMKKKGENKSFTLEVNPFTGKVSIVYGTSTDKT